MKYYTLAPDDYSGRLELMAAVKGELELVREYVKREPHAFLHAGAIARAVQGTCAERVLSLGADVLKEVLLCRLNDLGIDVVDMDEDFVRACESFVRRIDVPIRYHVGSWSDDLVEALLRECPDMLLLSQVDYLLDDAALGRLVAAAEANGILDIVVMSPSLRSMSGSAHPVMLARDWVEMVIDVESCLRTWRYRRRGQPRYRRAVRDLDRILGPAYSRAYFERYRFPSGVAHVVRYHLGRSSSAR